MSVKRRFAVVVLALLVVFSGCTSNSPEPSASSAVARPALTDEFVSRIDGSTSTFPLVTAALRMLKGTNAGLKHLMTSYAYEGLVNHRRDVIFVTPPSDEDYESASQAGVELEVIPIAKDGLVFLVNTANSVDGLTRQEIQDVYTGKVTNWSQVGGKDGVILPYQREIRSGSQTMFLQLAMKGVHPVQAPPHLVSESMVSLVDAISGYYNSESALGYSVFYYTQQMYPKENVKLLAIDGIAPTLESISNESYPYWDYIYAVVRADEPADSPARQLIAWLLGDEGQKVASAAGYVPLDPANIVPIDAGYGYFGSTPENTTESNGTGGSAGQVAPYLANPCWDSGAGNTNCEALFPSANSAVIPGYQQGEAAINQWIEGLPPGGTVTAKPVQDLLVVQAKWDGDPPLNPDRSAVFRLSDGHRMRLSDFFYNDVNYIEFINANLLGSSLDPTDGIRLVAPFTGLPNDYELFSASLGYINFEFPIDNPFLVALPGWNLVIGLPLPADLSPYGSIWRKERVMVGSTQVEHIVRDYTGTNPADTVFNRGVDAFAGEHPTARMVHIYALDNGVVRVVTDSGEQVFFDLATSHRIRVVGVQVGQAHVDHLERGETGPTPVDEILNRTIDEYARAHPQITTLKFSSFQDGAVAMESTGNPDDDWGTFYIDYATGLPR